VGLPDIGHVELDQRLGRGEADAGARQQRPAGRLALADLGGERGEVEIAEQAAMTQPKAEVTPG
jgi:hypothetical protein